MDKVSHIAVMVQCERSPESRGRTYREQGHVERITDDSLGAHLSKDYSGFYIAEFTGLFSL